MKKGVIIGIVVIAVFLLAIIGYFVFLNKPAVTNTNTENNPPASNSVSKPATTSKEPSELVLDVSDLPEGYVIKDRAPRVQSDIGGNGLLFGWKKGYMISFMKGENLLVGTAIWQTISIYPAENISKVIIPQTSNENVTYEAIEIEKIGDQSNAYKVTEKDEFLERSWYEVEFIKKDVYENIGIQGISNDFETIKGLAKKAASKI